MANTNIKLKQNLSESDSENEATEFPKFIVLESLKETRLTRLFLFLTEKKSSLEEQILELQKR